MIHASIGFESQLWRTWGKGGHLSGLESHMVKDTQYGLESHTSDDRLNWVKSHRGSDIYRESLIIRACVNRAWLRRRSVRGLMFRESE